MPRRYITEIVHQVRGWVGLNLREQALALGPKELSDCVNFDVGLHGELNKRTGFVTQHDGNTLGANPVHILGYFNTGPTQQIMGFAGGNIYTSSDAITWVIVPGGPYGNVEYGVQYITNFYIVRRDAIMLQWDGTTMTTVAGSPFGSFCRVFKDRLFVLNSYAAGRVASRVFFSDPFNFSATGWHPINYIGVGEGDGDVLVAVYGLHDHLLVFKSGSTFKLYVQGADITAWILRSFSTEVGCIGRDTIIQYEGTIYFCSAGGVYLTDGNSLKNISVTIDVIWDKVVVTSATINNHSAFIWKDKYMLVLETYPVTQPWSSWSTVTWDSLNTTPWSGVGSVYVYLVYHIRSKGWTKWAPQGINPHTFTTIIFNSQNKGIIAGERTATGYVYRYGDPVYADNAVSYNATVRIHAEELNEPGQMKRGKWTSLEMVGGGTFTATHVVNGQTVAPVTYSVSTATEEVKVAGPGRFRSWSIIVSQNQNQPLTIFGFGLVMQIGYGERRPVKMAT